MDEIILFSSETGKGKEEAWKALSKWIPESKSEE